MADISFEPPRGMRDFYPEDMLWRDRVFNAWRAAADQAGFQSYDACVVESLELLQRKAGEEVSNQIYAFQDKSGRQLALRPEMTPTLARMIANRQRQLKFPVKWTTIAQCFRYERMTRGRKREHYQWNLDIIGEERTTAEIELLATAVNAMRKMGVEDTAWHIHVSSRKLLSELLAKLGIPQDAHATVFLALDKLGKIPESEIATIMQEGGLSAEHTEQALNLLRIRTLDDVTAILGDSPALTELRELFEGAAIYGFEHILQFDIAVIRGLSYYTGIVFEAFDVNRTLRAIFGGGRYDNLLTAIGGEPTPAVGMGFGDVVIVELLKDLQGTTPLQPASGVAIAYMTQAECTTAMKLAQRLRQEGRRVGLMLAPMKPKQFFTRVGDGTWSHAIYVGPDDLANKSVMLKDLSTREATPLSLD